MKPRNLFACAIAPLALAACGQGDQAANDAAGPDTAISDNAAPTMSPTTAGAAAAPAGDPRQFVDAMAASDMFEIESSRLAETLGKSDAVKRFARMMVQEHTKTTNELKDIARTTTLTVSPRLMPDQQANLEALKTAGDNFDARYAQMQVAAHEQALRLLQSQAANGEGAFKEFAARTEKAVGRHLEEARKLP